METGLATGFATEELLSPVDGLHEYVNGPVPVTELVTDAVEEAHVPILVLVPASVVGNGFTVIMTKSEAVHPYISVTVRL